jgi:hypothetical protein
MMKTYKIEVHSEGYEDTFKLVSANSLQQAKQGFNVRSAIIEWCEHNDVDVDDMEGLPFTRISKVATIN